MANVLSTDKQIAIIGALAEGSSIRSIERITGIHRDTIMRLGVKIGEGCTALMNEKMRDLLCTRLEMDEIWGFVGKKDRNVCEGESGVGSVWTFCAIDAETKLVPAFRVGNRDAATANVFIQDVANRMRNRVQISTDGLRAYVDAIERSFGSDLDYAQIVKTYGYVETADNRRYSAPEFVSSEKKVIAGRPNYDLISTSYVERLKATTRLHMRRLTRLTLAFSKKRENFIAALGLHFAYYNFVKLHNTWNGVVEVFELHGHEAATKLYAWTHETDDPDNPKRHVTVLHLGPVLSPITAVRAFISQEFRNSAAVEA